MFINFLICRMFQLSPLVVFERSQQANVELHGRETADEFCLKMPDFHVTFRDRLHAVNLQHGTDGFTSPPKEGVLRIFFDLKNPTASVWFEPANLGTKGQHATSRPLKSLTARFLLQNYQEYKTGNKNFYQQTLKNQTGIFSKNQL